MGTFRSDDTINFIGLLSKNNLPNKQTISFAIHVHSELSLRRLTSHFSNAAALSIEHPDNNKECADYIGPFMVSLGVSRFPRGSGQLLN